MFEDIKDKYMQYSDFTDLQKIAIENVYYTWKIDKWANP